jgi:hypothetical protein
MYGLRGVVCLRGWREGRLFREEIFFERCGYTLLIAIKERNLKCRKSDD